jgi:hypothetical protein
METKKCNQKGCPNDGAFRFTWPGQSEDFICTDHEPQLKAIVSAMGFHMDIIPLEEVSHGD